MIEPLLGNGPTARDVHAVINITNNCNLRCRYCYHGEQTVAPSSGVMSAQTLRNIITKLYNNNSMTFRIYWHGGEPLLAGPELFHTCNEILAGLPPKKLRLSQLVTTNGTLLTESWARDVFARYGIHVSLSADGPEDINSATRLGSTFSQIGSALRLLRRHSVRFGIIAVTTRRSLGREKEIYSFLKHSGASGAKLHPCERLGRANTCTDNLAIEPAEFAEYCKRMFDVWVNDPEPFSLQPFSGILESLFVGYSHLCEFTSDCGMFIGVAPDGTVYPCNRFLGTDTTLGNINTDSMDSIIQRRVDLMGDFHFLRDRCECEYYNICGGGCQRSAFEQSGDLHAKDRDACATRKILFPYIIDTIRTGACAAKKNSPAPESPDPCVPEAAILP